MLNYYYFLPPPFYLALFYNSGRPVSYFSGSLHWLTKIDIIYIYIYDKMFIYLFLKNEKLVGFHITIWLLFYYYYYYFRNLHGKQYCSFLGSGQLVLRTAIRWLINQVIWNYSSTFCKLAFKTKSPWTIRKVEANFVPLDISFYIFTGLYDVSVLQWSSSLFIYLFIYLLLNFIRDCIVWLHRIVIYWWVDLFVDFVPFYIVFAWIDHLFLLISFTLFCSIW